MADLSSDNEFERALISWHNNIRHGAQSAFARRIRMAPGVVSRWVSRDLSPGEQAMIKIAKLLGRPLEEVKTWWPPTRNESKQTPAPVTNDISQKLMMIEDRMTQIETQMRRLLHAATREARGSLRKSEP